MPRYGCVAVRADQRPILGLMVNADDPVIAEQVARKLWQRVPGVDSVEVWLGTEKVYPREERLQAAG